MTDISNMPQWCIDAALEILHRYPPQVITSDKSIRIRSENIANIIKSHIPEEEMWTTNEGTSLSYKEALDAANDKIWELEQYREQLEEELDIANERIAELERYIRDLEEKNHD